MSSLDHQTAKFLTQKKIKPQLEDLPSSVWGFTYYSANKDIHIILNSNLKPSTKIKTLIHELKHALLEMYKYNDPKIKEYVDLAVEKKLENLLCVLAANYILNSKDLVL